MKGGRKERGAGDKFLGQKRRGGFVDAREKEERPRKGIERGKTASSTGGGKRKKTARLDLAERRKISVSEGERTVNIWWAGRKKRTCVSVSREEKKKSRTGAKARKGGWLKQGH